ncbi:unnamed protein product [Phytophthora fragariaefolia]|uniref:Unnamed protein product n=1 Tax=Phytophthora fragariaefolia TaxID=1490495 RepID=A0A9W6XMK3_9STRA|nr:unnamed protein product [Phytophthora fragariaefolia]
MRCNVFFALVVGAFAAVTASASNADPSALRSNEAGRALRAANTVEAAKKLFLEANEKTFIRGLAKQAAGIKKASQLTDEQLMVLKALDQAEAKMAPMAFGGVKDKADDMVKVVTAGVKNDEQVSKLVTEVAKKDEEVAKVVSGAANNGDEVAKLTKVISAGEKNDENAVKLAAGISAAGKTDDITEETMNKMSQMLAEELKAAAPKKRSLLRKLVYAALGATAGAAVIYTAYDLLKSPTTTAA